MKGKSPTEELGQEIATLLGKQDVSVNDALSALLSHAVTIAICDIGTDEAVHKRLHDVIDAMWADALKAVKAHSS